jgi:hypothetical protein
MMTTTFVFICECVPRSKRTNSNMLLTYLLTLVPYELQWDGDLNDIKANIKNSIEVMAANWTPEERQECVSGTPDAFKGGGSINSYLQGGPKCPM